MSDLLAAAHHLAAHGCSVVPVAHDGTKRPAVAWKAHTTAAADAAQIDAWFAPGQHLGQHRAIGVICGAVSGQLEMIEAEGPAVAGGIVQQLAGLMAEHGLAGLWTRLLEGWMEMSPAGGLHWFYRVEGAARGNTKLARRPAPTDGAPRGVQVLLETRGEGGFVVTAPTPGTAHPSGKPWALIAGGPQSCPVISVEERDALHAVAALLDEMPARSDEPAGPPGQPAGTGQAGQVIPGARPGDDFNAQATWEEILEPHGWQKVKRIAGGYGWVRPGKDPRDGISATTGTAHDGVDRLYVFTTSTEFEDGRPYNKFAAWAHLEHGGDLSAAAKALSGRGYGSPAHRTVGTLTLAPDEPGQPAPERRQEPRSGTEGAPDAGALATVTALPVSRPAPGETLAQSDDANGLALVDTWGHVLRYSSDRGRWYAWDGTVWAPCPKTAGMAREYAKRVARELPEGSKDEVAFKRKSLSAVGISNALTQAATIPAIVVDHTQLDAHPWELNTPGGIVDLRTGRLGASDPSRLHTRLTTCTPDPDADRSAWLEFLDTTFAGDQQLIAYMQRLVGYSAVGQVGAHVLPYCYGGGGNGKGVFLETCVRVLGDYATTAPSGFLMAKAFPGHETEIARLAGARMVVCSEVNEDDRFDEARVKQLTGGDSLTARFMQQDHFTFTPTHQLWAMGNHQPHVRAGGPSFWRRLRLIPFVHQVDPADVIDDLQGILASEHGPAVLAWIVEGAVLYAREGLREPESVRAATGEYAHDQDTVGRFLEERCHLGGGQHVTTKMAAVRTAYEDWCRESGDQPVSAKALGVALRRHGIGIKRTNTAKLYTGLALMSDDAEEGAGDSGWYR